jgi:hypothetical protein
MIARGQGLANCFYAAYLLVVAFTVWFLCTIVLLGDTFPTYVKVSLFALDRYGREGGFPFYWTVNSLATFAFFSLALIVVGRGLGKAGKPKIAAGDYFLFGGLVYALVGLKSGLNRADMWHLAPPFLVLIFAFILPLPKQLFAYTRRVHQLAISLILIMAATYFAALTPTGSYYASGLIRGLRDSVMAESRQEIHEVNTRAPTIELERSFPSPDVLELGRYLADPIRKHRPVVLYSRLWSLDKRLGVHRMTYPTDDFLLSDQAGYGVRDFLEEREDAVVIMDRPIFEHIFHVVDPNEDARTMADYRDRRETKTPVKRVLRWLSTIHYSAAPIETEEKEKRWERTVGSYVRTHYHKVAQFGELIVLAR